MFNLNHALAAWRRSLRFNRAFSADDLDELETHLRDYIDALKARGFDEEAAFHEALDRMGLRHNVEAEYRKVRWTRPKRRHTLARALGWHTTMARNYLRVTRRALYKEKGYAFINIFGLALGLAVCLLLFLFVQHEWTHDHFHANADRIHRVNYVSEGSSLTPSGATLHPYRLGPTLQTEIPDVEQAVRVAEWTHHVRLPDAEARSRQVLYADAAFFEVFDFTLRHGNPATALADPQQVILSASTARALFGKDPNPVGEHVEIRIGQTYIRFRVAGIVEDAPSNSTIQYQVILPFDAFALHNDVIAGAVDNWNDHITQVYVMLRDAGPPEHIEAVLDGVFDRYNTRQGTYRLRNLKAIYLTELSTPVYGYILLGIAAGILLMACINFMTLALGRSARRALEVGIRKAVGASRGHLMVQFWGEAFALTALALLLGFALAVLALPVFSALVDTPLEKRALFSPAVLITAVGLLLGTGGIAGGYPALLLSRFRPIETLTRRLRWSGAGGLTRSLVVIQFALAVSFIVCTLVMADQMRHIRQAPLGFDEAQVVVLETLGEDGRQIAQLLSQIITASPHVIGVTGARRSMGGTQRGSSRRHEDHTHYIHLVSVEANYFDFFDIPFVEGRGFDAQRGRDSTAIIVNEALVRVYRNVHGELDEPLGQAVPGVTSDRIVGVVSDFKLNALYQETTPALFFVGEHARINYVFVRLAPGALSAGLATIEDAWSQVVPDLPFRYTFLDDTMQRAYADDQQWSAIVRYASFFAIFIACLGLLGLATLTTARRIKELGIRKVLGASVPRLVGLVARDFLWLVVAGIAIAVPVGLIVMQRWLEDFAYRIELGPLLFIIGAVLALGLAASVVSLQAYRAARANPVDSLRYE
ncbi:MAG: ABC transporter permease [Bacteroidota bacterium]